MAKTGPLLKTQIERSLYFTLIGEGISEEEAERAVALADATRGTFVSTEHTKTRISVGGFGCDAEVWE